MLVNLRALLGVLVDIVLMRRGPEHLPSSAALLALVVAANLAVDALTIVIARVQLDNWVLQLLIGAAITLLWFRLALVLLKKRERYAQTMTAIFGTHILFLPAIVPLTGAMLPYLQPKPGAAAAPALLVIVFTFLELWLLVVQVRIVHAAFEWPYFAAVLFLFGQVFVSVIAFVALFGVSPSSV